ncbi:hypothetical protein BX600DRAFT_239902 [Xylariales sp. PMI_506]|nr:hypothetical protein BX600DRAFT_239902 [Xylariales sp. PMI_506]
MARLSRSAAGHEVDMDKRAQLLHDLDLKHQHGASKADLLVKDEDIRRLRVRILMLRDENTLLRDQITQNDDSNAKLAAQCSDLAAQLEAKIETVRVQEKQLKKQEREFTSLKSELQSMSNITQDSSNLLSEKLALTRELAVLKPELEHLRSQLTHQQNTLAEKLALERQVNTLEVELANEKKATKRAMEKRESSDRVEDNLRKNLREVEKQLASEKAQRERLEDQLEQEKHTHELAVQDQSNTRDSESDLRKKLQDTQKKLRQSIEEKERLEEELQAEKRSAKREQNQSQSGGLSQDNELRSKLERAEKDLSAARKEVTKIRTESQNSIEEAHNRSDAYEKKFEKLKTKFRELQDQLKQCQADLRTAQQTRPAVLEETIKKPAGRTVFKKRKAQDIVADDLSQISIATPSADDKPRKGAKKLPIEPTVVGEKSEFSITPFLNRSKSAVEETSYPDDDDAMDDTFQGQQQQPRREVQITAAKEPAAKVATNGFSVPEPTTTVSGEAQTPEQPKPRGRPKKVLGDAPSVMKNSQLMPKTALKKPSKTFDKVTETLQAALQQGEKSQPAKVNFTLPQESSTSFANATNAFKGDETKKKKRKVLGSTKTLFDDDEAEAVPVRKTGKVQLGGGGGGGGANVRARQPLGGVRNAFAGSSFSPLKRERRGVGASFLA